MDPTQDPLEIVFFDLETTIPTRFGQGYAILEFGAILVCPRTLVELHHYSTLVRPADLSLFSSLSNRSNGISREKIMGAPTFSEIADTVYDVLNGRIWAGHNIVNFDCVRIREAFAGINKLPPEPKGTIDSLILLTQKFGSRAGDMKMATLATYFGLGQQKHRSLDDVRMNLDVLKYCSTVLFLESSFPDILTANSWVCPNSSSDDVSDARSSSAGYLEVGEICTDSVSASFVPSHYGNQKIELYHKGSPLGLCFSCLNVRFGVSSSKFVNQAGLPRLNFVVDATPSLCSVLDACDHIAWKFYEESGGRSDWRHIVNRKPGYEKYPTARLHIPTAILRGNTAYSTEICKRESSGNLQRHIFDKFDLAELEGLLVPGILVDAFFWVDFYDYQESAGMRLVADKLIIYCA